MSWEPYVRIWREVATGEDVAMLLASDYRQLCKVVHAAHEFVRHHEIGQPRTQGTLYPMTIGEEEAWHVKWDDLLASVAAALAELQERAVPATGTAG